MPPQPPIEYIHKWIKQSDDNTAKSFLSCVEIKEDALHIMIRENKMEVLEFLLSLNSANKNYQDCNGDSPVHTAAHTNNIEALKLLLSYRAKMSCRNDLGVTSMFIALEKNHIDFVNALLEEGQKLFGDFSDIYGKYRQVCKLIFEGSVDRLGSFLSVNKGIDIDFKELKGIESPLLLAVVVGNFEIVETLIKSGANVNYCREDSSMSALHAAARGGKVHIADLLLEYNADVNCCVSEKSIITPLHYAVETSGRILVKMLLDRGATVDFFNEGKAFTSALHLAAKQKETEKCQLLINSGADVDRVNERGETALFVATSCRNLDVIEVLLGNKANPNIADKYGVTPFLLICNEMEYYPKNLEIVKNLIDYGADTDARNKGGFTALHLLHGQQYEIAKFLLDEGLVSDVNCKNISGETPIVQKCSRICQDDILLLRYGADINITINSTEDLPMSWYHRQTQLDDEPFDNLNCPVYAHFEQLKLLGYEVNAFLWSKYRKSICLGYALQKSTIQIADFGVELQQLKTTKIQFNPQKTLYDVLLMKQHEVTTICNSEEFENLYRQNNNDFENSHPHYGWLLNLQYRRGQRRRKLMDSVAEILENALEFDEPDLVTSILRYLKDYDLTKILKLQQK